MFLKFLQSGPLTEVSNQGGHALHGEVNPPGPCCLSICQPHPVEEMPVTCLLITVQQDTGRTGCSLVAWCSQTLHCIAWWRFLGFIPKGEGWSSNLYLERCQEPQGWWWWSGVMLRRMRLCPSNGKGLLARGAKIYSLLELERTRSQRVVTN